MKITINIDEEKILELAKTASMDELPNSILYAAKSEAVSIAVKEIRDKLVETSYYGNKESLYSEVKEFLYKQIEVRIKELIEQKFSEKNIEAIVQRHTDKTITNWLENKIYARLEETKKDIFIGSSYGEIENERRVEQGRRIEQEAHRAESEAIF